MNTPNDRCPTCNMYLQREDVEMFDDGLTLDMVCPACDYREHLSYRLSSVDVVESDRDIEVWEDVASACATASEFIAEMSDRGEDETVAMHAYASKFFTR